MSNISLNTLKEMKIRLDQEQEAKSLLEKEYLRYRRDNWNPNMNREEWRDALLIHFVAKSIESDRSIWDGI